MFCQNCGKEFPENIKYCNNCGAEQGIASSMAFFQEAPQQQSYDYYEPQQQMVIDVNIRTALRVGGFILVVLSVLSILISLMWHQYKHFINYVSAGDIIFLLAQSCMVVGGLLMICIPKPKTALQIGGIALEALSVLSVLAGLRYHQYSFLTTSGSVCNYSFFTVCSAADRSVLFGYNSMLRYTVGVWLSSNE